MKRCFLLFTALAACSSPYSEKNEEKPESEITITKDSIKEPAKDSVVIVDTFYTDESTQATELTFTNTKREYKQWEILEEGLSYLEVRGPIRSSIGDSKIRILMVNPDRFKLELSNAKELKTSFKTAPRWAIKHNYIALVNAGMFQFDEHGTNTAFMKNGDFYNNAHLTSDNTVVAFDAKDRSVPPFQIIDRKYQKFDSLRTKYNTLIQGIRIIDEGQRIVWSQQKKYWSTVCIGEDKAHYAYFIFSRSPFSVHDLAINIKSVLPDVKNVMYLEGGPEASFYINHPKKKVEMMGSYETGFFESDDNNRFWEIPNVIGVVAKEQ